MKHPLLFLRVKKLFIFLHTKVSELDFDHHRNGYQKDDWIFGLSHKVNGTLAQKLKGNVFTSQLSAAELALPISSLQEYFKSTFLISVAALITIFQRAGISKPGINQTSLIENVDLFNLSDTVGIILCLRDLGGWSSP